MSIGGRVAVLGDLNFLLENMRHVLHKPTKNQSMCVINGYGAFCPSMSGIIKHNRQFSKHSSLKKVQHAIHVDQCTVMPIYMNQSTKSINVTNVLNTN